MIRHAALLASALCLSLAGCHDARRDSVRSFLQSHPPDGFEVVAIPDDFSLANNSTEAVVPMKYRLTRPTVDYHDLFTLPRGVELARRITAVRGWAISSLPAGDPTREAIAAASADAREAFPIKRIATPKGTEVVSLVVLTRNPPSESWKVDSQSGTIAVAGMADRDPHIPFEDSPEVAARLERLDRAVQEMEAAQQKYLVERQLTASRSLARLRSRLKIGHTFEGHLPDQTPVQLVISSGSESKDPIVAVLTVQRSDHSSARFTGELTQMPSGEAMWRAARASTLSGHEPLTDAGQHPVLTLSTVEDGLSARMTVGAKPPVSFLLKQTEDVDLIPDVSPQTTPGQ